ncbi:MAG: hypothetical protein ACN4GM_08510 [Gammaproteobacteria bacterium]
MTIQLPLAKDKKLRLEFRIEPGCLGPDGKQHIDEFCRFAQKQIESIDADFIHWVLIPRHDKLLAEIQYKINNKILSQDQAQKYLAMFDKNLDQFEEHLNETLSSLIEQFLQT